MYNGVLGLKFPDKANIVGFADDKALVIVAKTTEKAKLVSESRIHVVKSWLSSIGLSLAEHKTEAVFITNNNAEGQRKYKFTIGNCEIKS